jgi:hypothetical protein
MRINLRQTSFCRKLLAYHETWGRRFHTALYNIKNFRVLTVTDSADRLTNHTKAHRAATLGKASHMFLFADELSLRMTNPLDYLWRVNGVRLNSDHYGSHCYLPLFIFACQWCLTLLNSHLDALQREAVIHRPAGCPHGGLAGSGVMAVMPARRIGIGGRRKIIGSDTIDVRPATPRRKPGKGKWSHH